MEGLRRHGIKTAVFHWFSGSAKVLDEVLANGHLVSINPVMLSSASGQRVLAQSPRERILVESDGPFTKVQGNICKPTDVALVYKSLAARWNVSIEEVIKTIKANFANVVGALHQVRRPEAEE